MRLILVLFFAILTDSIAQAIYFPPNDGEWETLTPESLNWNNTKIPELYNYLEEKNSKAFILLKDGKIVLEKYFDDFSKDSIWYWASAGKTLTSALVGIAQEEGFLNISDKTSDYLGENWTNIDITKENQITIRHQLTMTTGLNDYVENSDCTEPDCLEYLSDAGTRWAYHNAPYTLLEKVVEHATNQNYNTYFAQKIRNKIGMNGWWFTLDYNNVYFSTARSMARYGILIQNRGDWDGEEVIKDKQYIHDMITTSQDLNKSYGYLWWLNGKESYMIPVLRNVFDGWAAPEGPADIYSALGKNGQCLSISPSKGLLYVRMGNPSDDDVFIASTLNNDIWKFILEISKDVNTVKSQITYDDDFHIYPNPVQNNIIIEINNITSSSEIFLYNSIGQKIKSAVFRKSSRLDLNIGNLESGLYFLKIGDITKPIIKN